MSRKIQSINWKLQNSKQVYEIEVHIYSKVAIEKKKITKHLTSSDSLTQTFSLFLSLFFLVKHIISIIVTYLTRSAF